MSRIPFINFTSQALAKLPTPSVGRSYYKDLKEKGLALYITSNGAKTYFVRKQIKGKDQKLVLGSVEDLTVEQARKMARVVKGKIAEGFDPVAEKRKEKAHQVTFGEHFHEYLKSNLSLSPNSLPSISLLNDQNKRLSRPGLLSIRRSPPIMNVPIPTTARARPRGSSVSPS